MARCPAHPDSTPSLSVRQGDDGRALVHCHAGCRIESVGSAIGISKADLMAPRDGTSRYAPTTKRTHAKLEDAIEAVAKTAGGSVEATYRYHDAAGNLVMVVVRIAKALGKTFRPLS